MLNAPSRTLLHAMLMTLATHAEEDALERFLDALAAIIGAEATVVWYEQVVRTVYQRG